MVCFLFILTYSNKLRKELTMSSIAKMPAYMEYPADILNNETFIQLNMAQRGLLWTLRMYCWKNGDIPASYEGISKLVGISKAEAAKLFDESLDTFFESTFLDTDDGPRHTGRMFNKALEEYRTLKIAEREQRSKNGKKAAEKQWQEGRNGNAFTEVMGADMN
jgi:hypothetical protein